MKDREKTAEPRSVRRLFALFYFVLLLAGSAPLLLILAGHPFLPSQEYGERHRLFAAALAVSVGLVTLFLVIYSRFFSPPQGTSRGVISSLRNVSLVGFSAVLAAGMVNSLALAGYPAAHALVAGEKVALRYTVKSVPRWGDRRCHSKVTLESMPFMFDEICSVPEEFRRRLEPGMRIELEGRGTGEGLFYEQFRTAGSK